MAFRFVSKRKIDRLLSSGPHRKRLIEITKVLMKYGLDELIDYDTKKKLLGRKFTKHKVEDNNLQKLPREVRTRMAIEELDGAFIKIAQVLSNRPDIVPQEYIIEFEKLQDKAPIVDTDTIIQVIEKELNDNLENLFLMFDDEPLASGSIAQVHRAMLYDGTPVVVKVQKPKIDEVFKVDFDLLIYISGQAKRISKLKIHFENGNPIKQISEEIYKELDFFNELRNIQTFRKYFENDEEIYVPEAFSSYSSEKVLTMEYVKGIKITDTNKYQELNLNPEEIVNKLINSTLKQVFDYRFFHADPHPGNILVLQDKRICFIDFGLMGRISSTQRQNIVDLIVAFSKNDSRKIVKIIMKYVPKEIDVNQEELEMKITELVDYYYDKDLKEINVGEILQAVTSIVFEYKITFNYNVYLLIKCISSHEGIGKKVYPQIELAKYTKDFTKRIIKEQLSPQTIIKDLYVSTTDTVALVKDLPGEIRDLLNTIQSGRLRVNAGILDLRETIDYTFNRVEKIINRLSISIILASMIMGTALILRSSERMLDSELMLIFTAVAFLISLSIGILLMISFLRNKGF